MTAKPASDLLYDSEAALRLVDTALDELRGETAESREARLQLLKENGTQPMALGTLTKVLARAYSEVTNVLGSLRESRELLEKAAVDRLKTTNDKLMEVSSATEVAATDILDGLERALGMVDEIDDDEGARDKETVGALRDELFRLMGCMQFQDITSQQLAHASSVLSEMERRLQQLAQLFDPSAFGQIMSAPENPTGHFDPAASTKDAAARQAVADKIFDQKK